MDEKSQQFIENLLGKPVGQETVPYLEEVTRSLETVLATRDGRAVMTYLLSMSGLQSGSFHSQPEVMAFNEGRRDMAIKLNRMICAIDPAIAILMQQEYLEMSLSRQP
jgi:hypothetical protein